MSTVSKSDRSTSITLASASAGPFDLDFRLFDDDKLEVYVNNILRTDFTIQSSYVNGYDDNATVTFNSDLSIGDAVIIDSALVPWRAEDYIDGPNLTEKLNAELGRIWSSLSDLMRNSNRSLRFFSNTTPSSIASGKVLLTTGTGISEGPTADEIKNSQEYASQAAASALAAASIFHTPADLLAATVLNTGKYVSMPPYRYIVDNASVEVPHVTTTAGEKLFEVGTVFSSRAKAVQSISWGYVTPLYTNGDIIIAGGFRYAKSTGATSIPDINDWLLSGEFNVESFGAVGDDVTDDTSACQAALDALPAPGGEIVFPQTEAGSYVLSSKLNAGSKKVVCRFEGEALVSDQAFLPDGTNIFGFKQQGFETSYSEIQVVGDTVDQESIAGSKVNGLKVIHNFGSSSSTGGRHGIYGALLQEATTSPTSADRNYVGVQGQVTTSVGDGGADLTLGGAKGGYFGMSSIVSLGSGAVNVHNVTGAEINTRVLTGASAAYISGAQIVTKDEVNGAVYDTALAISKGGTGTVGKDTGILFGNMNGSHPVNSTGSLIASIGSTTVDKGIDFTSYTFTGDVLSAPNVGIKSTAIRVSGLSAIVEIGSLSASNTPAVDFHSSGNNIDHDARIVCSGGTGTAGNGTLGIVASALRPQPDNSVSLGQISNRWTEVFAAAGAINTSDAREKQDISSLDEAELRVATSLKGLIKKFRWKDAVASKGDAARIHVGVIAQEVEAAFEAEGLDGFKYGVLCYDEWDQELDENEKVIVPAGNLYGVRYEELFSFIITAL